MEPQRAPIAVVAMGKNVIAFDAFTGKRIWERSLEIALTPRLATVGECVFVLAFEVYCFRLSTGEQLWRCTGAAGNTLLAAHGVVLVGGDNGVVKAYAAADGRLLWEDGLKGKGVHPLALAIEGGSTAQIDRS